MKKVIIFRSIFCVLLLAICSVVWSQEQGTVTVITEMQGSSSHPAVVIGNQRYAVFGTPVSFTVQFNAPSLAENQRNLLVKSVTCEFEGGVKNSSLDSENKAVFTYTPNVMAEGFAKITLVYAYEQSHEESSVDSENNPITTTVWETMPDVTLTQSSDRISIYEVPAWSQQAYEKTYEKTDRQLTVTDYSKGYEDGWRFKWDDSMETTTPSYSVVKPNSGLPVVKQTTLAVKNYAPDGTTVWFSKEVTIQTYFYDTPTAAIAETSEQETNFYKNTGNAEWKVRTAGGEPSGWTIVWTGGVESGSGETYKPFPGDVVNNTLNKKIHVKLTNAVEGHVLYSAEFDVATINVYKSMTHQCYTNNMAMFVGEEVTIGVHHVEGGYPNGWEYSWTVDDKTISNTTPSMTVKPEQTTTYILNASNIYNGVVWDSFTETFVVTVYAKPSAKAKEQVTAINLNTSATQTLNPSEAEVTYTNRTTLAPDYHLVEGETISIGLETSRGMEDDWLYTIIVDKEKKSENKEYSFTPTKGTHTVRIEMTNGSGKLESAYNAVIERKYVVYEKPSFNGEDKTVNAYAGYNGSFTAASTNGGHKEGWTLQWEDGTIGQTILVPSPESITEKTEISNTYTVNYACEGMSRLTADQNITFIIWPHPKVNTLTIKLRDKDINKVKNITYYDLSSSTGDNITIDCFENDVLDIAYSVEGGYVDQVGDGWVYSNSKTSASNIPCSDIATRAKGKGQDSWTMANVGADAYTSHNYALNITNKPSASVFAPEAIWLDKTVNVTVRSWKNAIIKENFTDSISSVSWSKGNIVDVYAGNRPENDLNFNISHTNGYTEQGGWNYEWFEGGELVSTNDTEFTYTPTTNGNQPEDHIITAHITNKIGDNYSIVMDKSYYANVWPKAQMPGKLHLRDIEQDRMLEDGKKYIRTGNRLEFSVLPITQGYTNIPYVYNWNNTSQNTNTWSAVASLRYPSTIKKSETYSTNCKAEMWGPYNRVWDMSALSEEYTIYNKPETPKSIMVKGTGTSGTVICTTSVSDVDLEGREYWLAFGYNNGNEDIIVDVKRQTNPGDVRWTTDLKNVLGTHNNSIFVCAVWYYPEQNLPVTSGKCTINGVDEMWDYSFREISGITRSTSGTITGIENVTNDDTTNDAIYNISGMRVSNKAKGLLIKNGKKFYVK